jgi:hypothetical protein
MPLPTAVISNGFTFKIGSTQYECDVVSIEETLSQYGGEEVQTACGVLRTPVKSTITGLTVTMVENLASTGLFRYLRETAPTGAETVTYTGTSSTTVSATNPSWAATVSGWTKPVFTAQASGGFPTVTAEFSLASEPVLDIIP